MSDVELISVIIPTYNRYELLVNCIKSVLSQTYANIEIIVVNDRSTDQRYYAGHLEALDTTKLRIIHLDVNQKIKYNVPAAQGMVRQVGVENARGNWLAFLDDDDFYLPNKLELQMQIMHKENALFSSTNMYIVNHKTVSDDTLNITLVRPYHKSGLPHIFTKSIIDRTNFINNSTVIVHHSLLKKAGSFKPIIYEDWDMWKRILEYTDCLYIDMPLVYYTMYIDGNSNVKHYVY